MDTFKNFSPGSRTWIYQANRNFSFQETEQIRKHILDFVSQWVSHGKKVTGCIEMLHDRFLVVVVDEQEDRACGSSIDASLRFMGFLDEEFSIELLNRMNVSYRNGKEIITCTVSEIEKRLASGLVTENTIIFNHLVRTLNEFQTNWEIPLHKSWLMKYVKKQSV